MPDSSSSSSLNFPIPIHSTVFNTSESTRMKPRHLFKVPDSSDNEDSSKFMLPTTTTHIPTTPLFSTSPIPPPSFHLTHSLIPTPNQTQMPVPHPSPASFSPYVSTNPLLTPLPPSTPFPSHPTAQLLHPYTSSPFDSSLTQPMTLAYLTPSTLPPSSSSSNTTTMTTSSSSSPMAYSNEPIPIHFKKRRIVSDSDEDEHDHDASTRGPPPHVPPPSLITDDLNEFNLHIQPITTSIPIHVHPPQSIPHASMLYVNPSSLDPSMSSSSSTSSSNASSHLPHLKKENEHSITTSTTSKPSTKTKKRKSNEDEEAYASKSIKKEGIKKQSSKSSLASSSSSSTSVSSSSSTSLKDEKKKEKKKDKKKEKEKKKKETEKEKEKEKKKKEKEKEKEKEKRKKEKLKEKEKEKKKKEKLKEKEREKLSNLSKPLKKKSSSMSTTKDPSLSSASHLMDTEDKEEEFKWWLQEDLLGDGTIKWTTLEHQGVYFAPPYQPHRIPLLYQGQPYSLVPQVEEVATFFAAVIGTPYADHPVFCANFFNDFLEMIQHYQPSLPIRSFELCDFSLIYHHLIQEKEKKKAMSKEEKESIKKQKEEIDAQFGWAFIDGRKEKIGNFRMEPPGLFRGRGAHPKTGKLKRRIEPEDITINLGEKAPIPVLPPGRHWKAIVHNRTVTWLATWEENVNKQVKYVLLAASSSWKGMSDFKKFEKARELKYHVDRIRQGYLDLLKSDQMAQRQMSTALYFIDRLALRAGNEKGEDVADTVGCCSLRYEHVTLHPDYRVTFDFLGKDSIRYYNEVTVLPQVYKNLQLFKKGHAPGQPLFDRLTPAHLNKHLNSLMPGLTAKVFRTYNASSTFQTELVKTPLDKVSTHEKLLAYNRANRQVAVLCNHQRAVPKAYEHQITRLKDKLRTLKYERKLIKERLLDLNPKLKKQQPELTQNESDLEDTWIQAFLEQERVKLVEKAKKKRKEEEEGSVDEAVTDSTSKLTKRNPSVPQTSTTSTLEFDDSLPPSLESTIKKEVSEEKLQKKYTSVTQRISALKLQMIDKDENKTTALGTSKINYIDPRITVSWCRRHEVSIEKMFTKTLRDKFKWAMDVDATWEF